MTLIAKAKLPDFVDDVRVETFAIGDVHGQADLLDGVLGAIAETPRVQGRSRRLVQLGDLIDRGPESLRAIDLMRAAAERLGHEVVCLMGNHEMMLLGGIVEADVPFERRWESLHLWYRNGGMSVIEELVEAGHDFSRKVEFDKVRAALGEERATFLEGLLPHYRAPGERILYVHAGVHPRFPLDGFLGQPWHALRDDEDFVEETHWAWVRESFLYHRPKKYGMKGHHGTFVVHGHTPHDAIRTPYEDQVDCDRLNLDGYAFQRRKLRYARIFGRRIEVHELSEYDLEAAAPVTAEAMG